MLNCAHMAPQTTAPRARASRALTCHATPRDNECASVSHCTRAHLGGCVLIDHESLCILARRRAGHLRQLAHVAAGAQRGLFARQQLALRGHHACVIEALARIVAADSTVSCRRLHATNKRISHQHVVSGSQSRVRARHSEQSAPPWWHSRSRYAHGHGDGRARDLDKRTSMRSVMLPLAHLAAEAQQPRAQSVARPRNLSGDSKRADCHHKVRQLESARLCRPPRLRCTCIRIAGTHVGATVEPSACGVMRLHAATARSRPRPAVHL